MLRHVFEFKIKLFMSPNYVAPYNGLQGAAMHSAAAARNTGATGPPLSNKCNWVLLLALHKTWDFMAHLKDEAIMAKCLA